MRVAGISRNRLATAVLVVLCVSCTSEPTLTTTAPPPSPSGDLLAITSNQETTSIVRYGLGDGSAETLPAPIDPEAVNRSTVAGAGTPDGSLILAVAAGMAQVYRLVDGGAAAMPIGPAARVRGQEPQLTIDEHTAVVADCRAVRVLTLPGGRRWRSLGKGCWAAAGSDGRSVVSSPDGSAVVEQQLSGAPPAMLFDVHDLRPWFGTTSPPPRLIGTPALGPAGLAFLARAADQLSVFVRDPGGRIIQVLQERYANVYRVPHLAWQPAGQALAISDDVSPSGAVLRVFDAGTGELRALSLAPVGFTGIAWAPDGTSIALLTGGGELVVVRLDGSWLLRRDTDWRGLFAWSDT